MLVVDMPEEEMFFPGLILHVLRFVSIRDSFIESPS
jgi:hypothetical protein